MLYSRILRSTESIFPEIYKRVQTNYARRTFLLVHVGRQIHVGRVSLFVSLRRESSSGVNFIYPALT